MAGTIGDLKVRIGADISKLQSAMNQAKREINRAARDLADAGNRLSFAISLPFAAIGVSAIKAAGEVEAMQKAMETTMKDAGRSIEEARAELDALRKAAEAPGLDFEQAVKGSVRLQNVGFSAEKARQILVELANAVAMSGGSAQELDGVTRQFGQMIAKGRVLQEDLSIIQENMPAISAAMEKAFGTKSAEKLREMGVSAEEFVDGVTKQLALLPRVSGGINNAIVNAGVSIKMALATVGEALNQTFNISGNLEKFGNWISGLAKEFSELDDSTKRLIAGIGVFALVLGPAIRLGGMLVTAFTSLRAAFIAIEAGGFLGWMGKLSNAMRLTYIGIAIGLVLAFSAALASVQKDMSATAQAARALEEVNLSATKAISSQKAEVEALTAVIQDENATLKTKTKALNRLKEISPEYYGTLTIAKGKVEGLTDATNGYVVSILRAAKAEAARAKIQELDSRILDLQQNNIGGLEKAWNKFLELGSGPLGRFQTLQKKATEIKGLEAQKEALAQLIVQNGALADSAETTVKKTNDHAGAVDNLSSKTKKSADEADKAKEAYKKLRDEWSKPVDIKAPAIETLPQANPMGLGAAANPAIETLPQANPMGLGAAANPADSTDGLSLGMLTEGLSAINSLTAAIPILTETLTPLQVKMLEIGETGAVITESMTAGVISFSEAWTQMSEAVMKSGTGIEVMALAVGQSLTDAFASGAQSAKGFALQFLASAAKIIKAQIQIAVTNAAMKALSSAPFPYNIILAGVAGAAAGALFQALVSKVGIPALAEGGMATGKTLAMVGDNPNAHIDPEVISPLSKLQNMIQPAYSPERQEIYGVIRGADIELSNRKAQRERGRVR